MSKNATSRSDEDLINAVMEAIAAKKTAKESEKKPINRGRRYGPAEKRAILTEMAQGKKLDELREKYGICHETVNRWLRRESQSSKSTEHEPIAAPESAVQSQSGSVVVPPSDYHKGHHPQWKAVLHQWRSRPGLGPAQIRNQLHRAGIKINVATVRKILEENGYTPPKTTIKEIEINRYEAVRPLELVHMDFKHFYINKQKVYLLLLQDDFSRFLCGHRMTDSENMKSVIEAFEECVDRYGKMQSLITDAGSAFYSWNGINRFQKLISEEYGVDQIKAKTPRSNGKIENVNKQIEKEVLDVKLYASLEEASSAIVEWLRFYNFERTHMGLPKGAVPADRFLYGWNTAIQSKEIPASKEKVENDAWTEVMKVALLRINRAA
ncbi:DDE-type integrase/transposase/recombinase [Bdellovibrionota bacterium FG-2]